MHACIRSGILSTSSSRNCWPRLSHSSTVILSISLRVVGHGGSTEIQELSMTCLAQASQGLLLQQMTVTYRFQLGGTLTATPPCWIMLFVQPQDGILRPQLCAIGCMMRNFTPDVHCEVHLCNLDTMHHGLAVNIGKTKYMEIGHHRGMITNAHIKIGSKCSAVQMAQQHAEWTPRNWHHVLFTDECQICHQTDNRWLCVWSQPGQAERLRKSVQRVQQGGGSLMFWAGIMWGLHTPLVVMECTKTALWFMNEILWPLVLTYRQNIGEAFVFMDDNSCPHHARCEWLPSR